MKACRHVAHTLGQVVPVQVVHTSHRGPAERRTRGLIPRVLRTASLACLAAGALLAHPAMAQPAAYPSKPIRVLVPFPPGGAADVLARGIGQKLTEAWGVAVTVDNRSGAGGTVGMEVGRQMPADGYNFILMSNSLAVSQVLYAKLPYDIQKDFVPVNLLADSPVVIAANPRAGVSSMVELLNKAKQEPGKLTYGSCGVGTAHHLAMEIFKARSGASVLHVPYRGCAPAVTDAVGGQVDIIVSSAPLILPHAAAGRLRTIAVTNAERATSAPSIPTVAESAIPALKTVIVGNWYGFMAPVGTPPDIVAKFDAETRRIMQMPDVLKRLSAAGIELRLGSGKDLAQVLDSDLRQFKQVVDSAQIKPE
jgi:tripartite-type tricarboxylate transporter receptor subunit TctC